MLAPPDDNDHSCDWREYAKHLEEELAKLQAKTGRLEEVEQQYAELKRKVFGKKSEKMPPMQREVRRDKEADRAATRRKRRERAIAKTRLLTETQDVQVPAQQRICPKCGNEHLRSVGTGKPSTVYEYVPGYILKAVVAER